MASLALARSAGEDGQALASCSGMSKIEAKSVVVCVVGVSPLQGSLAKMNCGTSLQSLYVARACVYVCLFM